MDEKLITLLKEIITEILNISVLYLMAYNFVKYFMNINI